MDERVGVVDVRADVRVDAHELEFAVVFRDLAQHRDGRPVRHEFHRGGKHPVVFGHACGVEVVWVADVVAQLLAVLLSARLGDNRVRGGRRDVFERTDAVHNRRIGARWQQCDAELLVFMRGRDELVASRVDAGRDAQHDPRALAQPARDRGDARRFIRLVDHDLRKAFGDRELDLRVRLVVAMQHKTAPRHAGGERDAHLPHRARVHVEPRFGDDARHLLGEERFARVAHVRRRRAECVRGGFGETPCARTHFVEVEHVER